ncbi:MAG: AI-2E family transporter [Lachnospiraceae bacterium]|nr:AI-2E family transporter [Lachnospiraceae bacterium]
MFDDPNKQRQLTKWVISVIAICILFYLGLRHITSVAKVIINLIHLVKPLLVGIVLALILNVPMSFIEHRFLAKSKIDKGKRPLAIVLSLFLVIGIFIGVAFLVIPELIEAIKLIVQIATKSLDQLAQIENNKTLSQGAVATILGKIDIDWMGLKIQLENWFKSQSSNLMEQATRAAGAIVSTVITFVIGLTFAIYILAQKEILKRQTYRLIHVWLPKRFGNIFIHVAEVCGNTFKLFIAGQATEAIILGTLCMIGMAILRLPYAPMIGALVGVTALIPIVGAFVGTIVGAIMILTVDPFKAIIFVIFLLILQQIEGNIIYPQVVGSKLNLPAIWVLAAVTIGGNLSGPFGMLIGVPAASAAYALIKEATTTREKNMQKNI